MKNNISLVIRDAKRNLTRLGLVLFYVYILLAILGAVGLLFGVSSICMKVLQVGSVVNTPWHEVLLFNVVAAFMLRFFWVESIGLTKPEVTRELPERDYEEEPTAVPIPTLQESNVIPFKRKSQW